MFTARLPARSDSWLWKVAPDEFELPCVDADVLWMEQRARGGIWLDTRALGARAFGHESSNLSAPTADRFEDNSSRLVRACVTRPQATQRTNATTESGFVL